VVLKITKMSQFLVNNKEEKRIKKIRVYSLTRTGSMTVNVGPTEKDFITRYKE